MPSARQAQWVEFNAQLTKGIDTELTAMAGGELAIIKQQHCHYCTATTLPLLHCNSTATTALAAMDMVYVACVDQTCLGQDMRCVLVVLATPHQCSTPVQFG